MKKLILVLIAVVGFGVSVSGQVSCVKMTHSQYSATVHLSNSCNRSVAVSVNWTDASGRAQSRNVTVPAWNERENADGYASVNVGSRVTNVRIGEPRRVVPRR